MSFRTLAGRNEFVLYLMKLHFIAFGFQRGDGLDRRAVQRAGIDDSHIAHVLIPCHVSVTVENVVCL